MGIPEALSFRSQHTGVLLAGEREGARIPVELTEGIAFDLGNSPREFKNEIVAGKTIVMTTTNGTRALRACAHVRFCVQRDVAVMVPEMNQHGQVTAPPGLLLKETLDNTR